MTLGAVLAAKAKRRRLEVALACELDDDVTRIYRRNFRAFLSQEELVRDTSGSDARSIETLLPGELASELRCDEKRTRDHCGQVDLVMGGPPCQGNSDLNNRTRRNDARNSLYERMGRAAEVLRPKAVIIENVPPVVHAKGGHVDRVEARLRDLGYAIHRQVLRFDRLGVPQARRRHFLFAVEEVDESALKERLSALEDNSGAPPRTVRWAIEDLEVSAGEPGTNGIHASARPSKENERRLAYFERNPGEYVLPDEFRPDCHRLKPHSYKSIYGRMRWSAPAQTVTTGFGSMGQGCYVHPSGKRTITPREAARLQTFPDFFDFEVVQKRTKWAMAIGNAVPPLGMREIVGRILELL